MGWVLLVLLLLVLLVLVLVLLLLVLVLLVVVLLVVVLLVVVLLVVVLVLLMHGVGSGPLLGACSTWASAGLGVDLGVDISGRRGGLGSLVVSLVGAWGAWWGPGGRRGGGFHVRGSTSGRHPRSPGTRHATKSNLHADSDCFTCTTAAVEN
jgi:hypothetical protein